MYLTRSIRRKLVLSLALVTAMLGLLAFGAISGLLSYRTVVNDLDYTISKSARRGDLFVAIWHLFGPLAMSDYDQVRDRTMDHPLEPEMFEPLKLTHAKFSKDDENLRGLWKIKISETRDEIQKYRRKMNDAPLSRVARNQYDVANPMLDVIENELDQLERVVTGVETPDPIINSRNPWWLVVDMANRAEQVPDPEEGLGKTLDDARNVWRSRMYFVGFGLALTLILFAGLVRCGYVWIFVPIRKLHQGAARVAYGDFDYRVHLTGRDEMVELAETFNQMVDRFQQIKTKLDQEVEERSRQLVRSERLAGVGFLAAGVAHEINNPLSAIAMAAESLEYRVQEAGLANGPPAPEDVAQVTQYLSMIQKEAFRCREITARLLDFARGQDAPKTRQDLGKLVSEVLEMVSHLSKFRGHTIQFDRQKSCIAEVNGAEIKQVILNMVANALEAMEGQGSLQIQLEELADEVVMSFRDTGCGMTPYVIENLFEPFFTERKSGKGTGLGLSISHRIVSEHGGRIEALSDGPGTGSCFRIHIPRKTQAALSRAA